MRKVRKIKGARRIFATYRLFFNRSDRNAKTVIKFQIVFHFVRSSFIWQKSIKLQDCMFADYV